MCHTSLVDWFFKWCWLWTKITKKLHFENSSRQFTPLLNYSTLHFCRIWKFENLFQPGRKNRNGIFCQRIKRLFQFIKENCFKWKYKHRIMLRSLTRLHTYFQNAQCFLFCFYIVLTIMVLKNYQSFFTSWENVCGKDILLIPPGPLKRLLSNWS